MAYKNKADQLACQRRGYQVHKIKRGEEVRARVKKIRKYVQDYKTENGCSLCHENHPACLDFHHNDPSLKDGNIAQSIANGWGLDRLRKEIAKCTLLCSNCHRKMHWAERHGSFV
jgi:hypothetical protein